jgi:hypothetical protein
MRWLSAHLAATYAGSLIITVGIEELAYGAEYGPAVALGGAGRWLGGFLIFFILGLLSAPIGIGLRFVLGRIRQRNLPAAVITGVLVGLVLIPVLHPAMYPGLSLETDPIGLLLVHGLAGAAGGLAWFGTELFQTPMRDRAEA